MGIAVESERGYMIYHSNTRNAFSSLIVILVTSSVVAQIWVSAGTKNRAQDMGQLRIAFVGIAGYASDYNDKLPLSMGNFAGKWSWNSLHYVPADWPSGQGGDAGYPTRKEFSKYFWATTILGYLPGNASYWSPGTAAVETNASQAARGGPRDPMNVSYSYSGTLSQYPVAAVRTPSKFPLLWQGFGKAGLVGTGMSNPNLFCLQNNQPCQYVPTRSGCAVGLNGQQSSMFTLSATVWVYDKTSTWLSVDGTASFRPLGARIAPDDTDLNVDPFTKYDPTGMASFFWTDGCHPWLFRPDAQY